MINIWSRTEVDNPHILNYEQNFNFFTMYTKDEK